MLHYTDEEAVHYMQSLIDISIQAMMAAIVEQLHKVAMVGGLSLSIISCSGRDLAMTVQW